MLAARKRPSRPRPTGVSGRIACKNHSRSNFSRPPELLSVTLQLRFGHGLNYSQLLFSYGWGGRSELRSVTVQLRSGVLRDRLNYFELRSATLQLRFGAFVTV